MDRTSVCLIALLAVLAAAIAQEEMYPDTYDHIDADEILSNEALRVEYYNCLMDTGPCASDEQQFLKKHAVEAFVTNCRKCTEKQKIGAEKITVWYTQNRPQEWQALVDKFISDAKKMNISPA